MNKTGIEYLDYTWNPIAMRCSPVSEGCKNCWHIKVCDRLAKNPKMPNKLRRIYTGKDTDPVLIEERLNDPAKRKKPAIIGVQFMGDLSHRAVKFDDVHWVWDAMKQCPQHTFLVLTKRPRTLRNHIERIYSLERMGWAMGFWRHVWVGVTVENQKWADIRIPELLKIPAQVHFVSYEPALEAVNFMPYVNYSDNSNDDKGIDFLIAGCESGINRRSAKIDWFEYAKFQAVCHGIPFFLKQMEFNGTIVKMPVLDGQVWNQFPKNAQLAA